MYEETPYRNTRGHKRTNRPYTITMIGLTRLTSVLNSGDEVTYLSESKRDFFPRKFPSGPSGPFVPNKFLIDRIWAVEERAKLGRKILMTDCDRLEFAFPSVGRDSVALASVGLIEGLSESSGSTSKLAREP